MLGESQKKLLVSNFFYAKGKPLIRMFQRRALNLSKASNLSICTHRYHVYFPQYHQNSYSVGDGDTDYRVTLLDGVDNILSCYDFSKHGMFAI